MPKPPNILEGESLEEFNALCESLYSQMEPVNDAERRMVDMMAQHEWFMRRALRMQEHLEAALAGESQSDEKRLKLVARYYKTHERAYGLAKRDLENMRKHKRRMDAFGDREEAESRSRQRQWEQILKKMPTLTDWVN